MAVVVPVKKLNNYWSLYFLIAIPLLLVFVFCYYPIFNGFVHIFYRWDGNAIEEFAGLENIFKAFRDHDLWSSFLVVCLFVVTNVFKMIIPIITAVVLHHVFNQKMNYFFRVCFVIPMIVPGLVHILLWKYFYEPNFGVLNEFLRAMGIISGNTVIQWLSEKMLVLPSLIFMGFPWVGAFGVLIYLAGLQNIPQDVYEAAAIDGAGMVKVFTNIELPLIMTQVRINLILMIIGTLQSWESVYLFLGESGGPGGVATVPGLLIFREAFAEGFFGYGCAVGFILFVITLLLTFVNNKYVRVRK